MTESRFPRLFAIVPAAGHSRRMGQPKLLLPLVGTTVIARMLAVLRRPEILETIVVIRPNDEPLRAAVAGCVATALQPETPPPEMRQSVEHALREIDRKFATAPDDGWLLAPADHPLLDSAALDPVISAWRAAPRKIVVPVHEGRRGHPTIFPFALAKEVFSLPADQGLNHLLQLHATDVVQVPVASAAVVTDLDTPEDYERLQEGRLD